MTAELDLGCEAYLYAQDLDNLGGTEYWRVTAWGNVCERLLPSDARLAKVRETLDLLNGSGRLWLIGSENFQTRVNFNGDCVVTVFPQTLDLAGRISPVSLLFNAFGESREQASLALAAIPSLMGRKLAPEHIEVESKLKRTLRWPRIIISLHVAIFSRRDRNA